MWQYVKSAHLKTYINGLDKKIVFLKLKRTINYLIYKYNKL
jgi:hypothetical protein